MAYRDELINRLKAAGEWDSLGEAERATFNQITDDQARRIMSLADGLQVQDEDSVAEIASLSMNRLMTLFNGELICKDPSQGVLTESGVALAELFITRRKNSQSDDQIRASFNQLNEIDIATLLTAYTAHKRRKL